MGLRFFKRVRLLPGLTLNLSKRGASVSVGEKGAHITVGTSGVTETVGLPGTGASYSDVISPLAVVGHESPNWS
jgi:hypothetical protein